MANPTILDAYGRPLPPSQPPKPKPTGLKAAYDSAQTTDENVRHWRFADGLSARAANSTEIRRVIRERARYEVGSNSFAMGIVDTLANDTIGRGPRLKIAVGQRQDQDAAKRVQRAWHRWCELTGLAAKLRTGRKAKAVDGETFLLRTNNPRLRSPVQLDIRLIETDQVESAAGDVSGVSGLKFDRWGNVTAYDVLPEHPGDHFAVLRRLGDAKPIDADHVVHLYRADRPGQARGISELTPALPLFAMLRRFTLAVIRAAETAADLAAVLQTEAAAFDEDGNPTAEEVDAFEQVPIDRGMMVSVPKGWKMNQFRPEQPTSTYDAFRNAILNEIARCISMPANKARCDSSGYNFASGKLDHGTYYSALDVERDYWAVHCLDRIFEWWLEEAALVGLLDGLQPDFDWEWYWDPHASGDPTKEANALATVHALGLVDEDAYLLINGHDPDEFWERRREQIERRAEVGLPPAQYYLDQTNGNE